MSDHFWLTKAQLKRIESHFPKPRGAQARQMSPDPSTTLADFEQRGIPKSVFL